MKNKIKNSIFLILALLFIASCARSSASKVDDNETVNLYKNKKQKQGKPSSQQHSR